MFFELVDNISLIALGSGVRYNGMDIELIFSTLPTALSINIVAHNFFARLQALDLFRGLLSTSVK